MSIVEPSVLARIPLFSAMSDEERGRLAPWLTVHEAAAGEVLLWEGRPHGSLFVLERGRVVVTKQIRGETEAVLVHLEAGAHFGEIDLIDSRNASASVTAETACRLLVLDQEQLRVLLRTDERLFGSFAWALLQDLAVKLRRTNQKLQETIIWGLDATASDPGAS
jgi:CRP-like cAMP-binding protein